MKKWPWRKILAIFAGCLVIAGAIPFARCLWYAYEPRPEPLVMEFPLRKGEYASSPFNAGFDGPYRIDLDWDRSILGNEQKRLDLDWKIVDAKRGIVAKGSFDNSIVGNTVCLGGYPAGFRKGQRIVVTLPHDVQNIDESMRLKVSVDAAEISLDMSYAWGIAVGWAGIIAGPGALLLVLLAVLRMRSHSTSPSTP